MHSGFRSSLPPAPSHARSSAQCLCLAGTLHEAPEITEVAYAKLLEACLRQRTRVVDALAKRIILNGSLLCQLILLSQSRVCCTAASISSLSAPSSLSISFSWLCWTRFQHRTSLPSAPCDQSQPATAALLVVNDDLIGLACGLSAALMLGCRWHRFRRLFQSRHVAQVGYYPIILAEKVLSLDIVARPRKLDERSWLVVRIGRHGLSPLVGLVVL